MRIISGAAKGRKLYTPPPKSRAIRPTSDRAREALFNIIGDQIIGRRVLDLFAGTGALGLEALSRGAVHASFVDISPQALSLVQKNIQIVMENISHQLALVPPTYSLHKADLSRPNVFNENGPLSISDYDLIFIDPPYSKGLSTRVIENIDKLENLQEDTLVIIEDRAGEKMVCNLQSMRETEKRQYGDTVFRFLRTPQ